MFAQSSQSSSSSAECINEEGLAALLDGELEPSRIARVHAHAEGCAACHAWIVEAVRNKSVAPLSAGGLTTVDAKSGLDSILNPLVEFLARRNAERRIGTVIGGKWTIESILGSGGMGHVFAARHKNGRAAAIKILRTELSDDAHLLQRFLREGRVANRIEHPSAVAILDEDVTEDGSPYLVMEKLEGQTLREAVDANGPQSLEVAIKLTHDLLDVLVVAHGRGILHRDIKPENLFLTTTGELKVLDFGLARWRDHVDEQNQTISRTMIGTPAYVAPEQARGAIADVDERSDIWSVGATLWMMLTGKPVRSGRVAAELLYVAMTQPAPSIEESYPEIPSAIARVVDRAIAFDKADRWINAQAMKLALTEAVAACAREPRKRERRSSSLLRYGRLASVSILAVVAAFVAFLGPSVDRHREAKAAYRSLVEAEQASFGQIDRLPRAVIVDELTARESLKKGFRLRPAPSSTSPFTSPPSAPASLPSLNAPSTASESPRVEVRHNNDPLERRN